MLSQGQAEMLSPGQAEMLSPGQAETGQNQGGPPLGVPVEAVFKGPISSVLMHMVAPHTHFQDIHRELWHYRENNMYTDVILVCQDGLLMAHSTILAKLFYESGIRFVPEDEPQKIILPNCNKKQVEEALIEAYVCGSVGGFLGLLSIKSKRSGSFTEVPSPQSIDEDLPDIGFEEKPDLPAEEDLLNITLKNLDDGMSNLPENESGRRKRERKLSLPKILTSDSKPFKCSQCKYSATSHAKLELHSKSKHFSANKYACQHCTFRANKQSEIKVHLKNVHDIGIEGRRAHNCIHCNQFQASNKKMLDLHIIEVHKNVRKYHCDQCSYTSNYLNNFQRHQKAHMGIPGNFLCPHCPKAFYVEAKLRSHLLVHSDDKNFVCDECAAKFKRKDDLKVHMKTHLPDEIRAIEKAKKLTKVCETCGKKFEKNWKLKRHMVVHNKDSGVIDKSAPRWQSNKGLPIQEYIVLTTDAKFIETTDKFITPDRIVVSEPKFLEASETKFISADGKCVTADRIVFNQIQYTDS